MLRIKRPGFYVCVQDYGRTDFRHYGVPRSGVADRLAAARVNSLLENPETDAMLEIVMQGPELEFEVPSHIVISGGWMEAWLGDEALEMDRVYAVPKGAVLQCGRVRSGFRAYLGVKGGIRTKPVMGSRSQFFPVTPAGKLVAGDALPIEPSEAFEPKLLKLSPLELYREVTLDVAPGPEFELLDEPARDALFNTVFTLAKEHDRMACQLQETLPPHTHRMITSATLPGTVQLTPAGKLILLMPDGQTTGGYPRMLQLSARAQSILAQKKFGDRVRFREDSF
ncbi:biotin-dependent carboxyltransferase family protein [Robiginitalea sp. M366]|uniref:5-oxoprolinase subunit C family protein n=1 Tax=Robiginitalea aestuariiviva TaxID=3036903 RepID=UPI00240CF880|nr:biotin-dependent carboxyltransferase family protein [Robiginitalea aestuariiviva]MDG1572834.1 biotin-dependent carboxyltransferase family protein [Robiginitalea aestuariiviva]